MTDISTQSQTESHPPAPNSPSRPAQEWQIVDALHDAMHKAGIAYYQDLYADGAVYLFKYGKKGGLRGNYRKEDVFDTIISLRKPPNYDLSAGARFEVHYEKARNFQGNVVLPFEAWLKNEEGKTFWQVKDIEKAQLDDILTLKDKGFNQKEIAKKLRISQPTVSRRLREIQKGSDFDPMSYLKCLEKKLCEL